MGGLHGVSGEPKLREAPERFIRKIEREMTTARVVGDDCS
jgi:hypothetical protein